MHALRRLWAFRVHVFAVFGVILLSPLGQTAPQYATRSTQEGVKITVARAIIFDKAGGARLVTHRISAATGRYRGTQSTDLISTKSGVRLAKAADVGVAKVNAVSNTVAMPKARAPAARVAPAVARYFVQVGAFKSSSNAKNLRRRLNDNHPTQIHQGKFKDQTIYKVLVGPVKSHNQATKVKRRIIRADGLSAAFVVTLPPPP